MVKKKPKGTSTGNSGRRQKTFPDGGSSKGNTRKKGGKKKGKKKGKK